MLLLLSWNEYLGVCGQFCPKKLPFLTTNVSGPVEQNLLVKHPNFIADSERAWKVDLRIFIGAEQMSF